MNISARSSKLQGLRPAALQLNKSSSKIMKKKNNSSHVERVKSPVVVYLVSPKIIHVRGEEFKGLVQRLTGKQASSEATVKEKDDKQGSGGLNYEDVNTLPGNLAAA